VELPECLNGFWGSNVKAMIRLDAEFGQARAKRVRKVQVYELSVNLLKDYKEWKKQTASWKPCNLITWKTKQWDRHGRTIGGREFTRRRVGNYYSQLPALISHRLLSELYLLSIPSFITSTSFSIMVSFTFHTLSLVF
jgi:hypothetical protein